MPDNLNWSRIYLEFSPKLLGICRRYVHDQATAEDLLQDSFLTAMQKHDQLKSVDSLYPWLKKIVVNNALQYLRVQNTRVFTENEEHKLQDISTNVEQTINDDTNLLLEHNFSTEELLLSMDQLSPHHRSVFNLFYLENYSHAEISETLGINVNTSKSHLLRAKKSLQVFLKNYVAGKEVSALKKFSIRMLVLFGLGNLLWAKTLQSKFGQFELMPSTTPDFVQTDHFSVKTNSLKKESGYHLLPKAMFLTAFLAGIVSFGLRNGTLKNFPKMEFAETLQYTEVTDIGLKEAAKPVQQVSKFVSLPTASVENENSEIKPIINQDKKLVLEKTDVKIAEPKNSEKSVTAESIVAKTDSALKKPERKQVIVVKKIIKRDTVYVER